VGAAGEAVGGQGKSHDLNTVSTVAALFGRVADEWAHTVLYFLNYANRFKVGN
jgi:hypothetical protein